MPQGDVSDMSPEEIAEAQKQNCIFCKIVAGEVPSKKVYEDDKILGIMDIRPATKGHVLVLPKEHYPILPLVPEDTFKEMFRLTKDLSSSIKKAVPATGTTTFIANGAAAGQQSPHFLFHIIARDSGDGLEEFDMPQNAIDQSDILEPLRKNVGITMKKFLEKEGKMPQQETHADVKNKLAQMLEANPQLREAIINEPEQFKEAVKKNPQLAQAFEGIDIDKLSAQLEQPEEPSQHEQEKTKKTSEGSRNPVPQEEDDEDAPIARPFNKRSSKKKGTRSTSQPFEGDSEEKKSEKTPKTSEDEADLDKISRLFK